MITAFLINGDWHSQFNSTAERMATGAEEVAAQTGTVATASEEMAATSMSIAQNCHQAAGGSEQANSTARTGAAVVERTVAVMGRIASRVHGQNVLTSVTICQIVSFMANAGENIADE